MRINEARQDILTVHENTGYYEDAAKSDAVAMFWDPSSPFSRMFRRLECHSIIELAVGYGRHVPKYLDKAERVVLVDSLQGNIDVCQEIFGDNPKVEYYANNGVDLAEIEPNGFDSLFCYDAMVHFELLDVASYLAETFRVLAPGGRALFHHSCYSSQPTNIWTQNPHNRNYMSNDIFCHLADRAGLEVLDQRGIQWGGIQDLDGLTLLEKPR